MGNISTYLQQIMNAVYGEQVRSAIHDAINQCYIDASAGITPTITVTAVDGGTRVDIAVGADIISFVVQNGTATTQEVQYYVTEWLEENPDFYTTEVELLSGYIDDLATTGTYTKKNFYRCTSGRNSGTAITENSKQAYVVLTQEEATAHSIIYDNSVYSVEVIKVRDGSVISQSAFVTTSPIPYLDGTYDTAIINFKRQDTADLTAMERRLTLFYESSVGGVALASDLDDKVDKVTGKGLSTEDYTTTEKAKLAGLTQIEVDDTLSVEGRAADAKAVGDRIEETEGNLYTLKSDLEEHGILKKYPIVTYLGNYTIGSNGVLAENANYDAYAVKMNGCESVVVNTANIYGFFNGPLEITSTYRPYTTDGTRHLDASNAELTTDAEYIVCANTVTSGVVVTARNADDTETIQESIERLENGAREIDDVIGSVFVQYNLSQAIKIANHRIRFDKTTEENGLIDYYKIPVEEGGVYRVTNIVRTQNCLYCFFDSNDNITYAYPSTNQPNENVLTTETVTIPTDVAYLGINDLTRWQSVSPSVEKQVKELADEAIPSNILRSPLEGLYLVTAGDSITIGHGIEDSESMTDDERPTYGKLASDFYGTQYHNIGMSGRTMADIKVDGVTRNGFAVDRYQLVTDDTDILTIWFGWNDCAHGANSMRDNYCLSEYGNLYNACTAEQQAEADTHNWEDAFIGTINSTDKTTWSGAWNFVLEYFTVTKPIEHLGVIIPFLPLGSFASAMRERLVEICKNYGVSYIDSANPNEIPTVAYCDSNRNTNYKNYLAYRTKYTADTLHPNKAGYKRIARGYIPWIARI